MGQEITTEKKKRIKQISVTNLFGIFNHTIPLHLEDRITIIHSPNGFGKTVILKLLDALFSRNNQILRETPFDEFRVDFDDNTSFYLKRTIQQRETEEGKSSTIQQYTFYVTDEKPFPTSLKSSTYMEHLSIIEQIIPTLRRATGTSWLQVSSGELLSLEEVVTLYG